MIPFDGNVLFVGYGAVAQCTLPILVRHVGVPLPNITVMDFEDRAAALGRGSPRGSGSSASG